MESKPHSRRAILQSLGVSSLLPVLPAAALDRLADPESVVQETLPRPPEADSKPKYSIRFAVCGMSHDHIYGMVGAIQRGGGELVAAHGEEPDKLAAFTKRYPDVKRVISEDQILNDASIQLVLSSTVASRRAPLGVRDMAMPEVVASQIANVAHPDRPRFQDFGDMMLRGNRGMGYVRLDWFTPDGLGTWVNRTHLAQDQTQCLLAAELSIRAQRNAKSVSIQASTAAAGRENRPQSG